MADTDINASAAGAGGMMPLYALLPPAVKQIALLVGLAAAVAAGVALVLWSQGDNYTPLYSSLADRDVGEITTQLDSANIPYKLDAATGSLLVPADRKWFARVVIGSVIVNALEKLDLHFPKVDKAALAQFDQVRIALEKEGRGGSDRAKKVASGKKSAR